MGRPRSAAWIERHVLDEVGQVVKGSLRASLTPRSRLPELGIDSLDVATLAARLEEVLGIAELPLERWLDAESQSRDDGFRVDSLVAFCIAHAR